ncbi:hypothetical protein AB0D97_12760 [Streptomyces roseus]|uniref:hypothetical protein n=1 Tax=Streptomyces roseus TaxID=66430 RepID=UPI0033C4AE24
MGYRRAANRDACLHNHLWPEHLAYDYRGWGYCRACQRGWIQNRQSTGYIPAVPDEAAVKRAVLGDPPARLTPREREIAVRSLTDRGLPAWLIAEHVRCTPRTVHRIRTRNTAA